MELVCGFSILHDRSDQEGLVVLYQFASTGLSSHKPAVAVKRNGFAIKAADEIVPRLRRDFRDGKGHQGLLLPGPDGESNVRAGCARNVNARQAVALLTGKPLLHQRVTPAALWISGAHVDRESMRAAVQFCSATKIGPMQEDDFRFGSSPGAEGAHIQLKLVPIRDVPQRRRRAVAANIEGPPGDRVLSQVSVCLIG